MKWLLRITIAFALLLAALSVAALLLLPRYAQELIDRATAGQNLSLKLYGVESPGIHGMDIARIEGRFTTKPDSCTGIASTFHGTVHGARLSWKPTIQPGGALFRRMPLDITLDADSLEVLMEPAKIRFRDRNPRIAARIELRRDRRLELTATPESVAYDVEGGSAETGKLRLEGISYKGRLARAFDWVQQPAPFRADSLFSAGEKMPLSVFRATFGLQRSPDKPCTLTFRECSVNLAGIGARTALVEYSLRKKQTRFTLLLDTLAIEKLSPPRKGGPRVTGSLRGSLPIEYAGSTIRLMNGSVESARGTAVEFRSADGKPLFSIDAGPKKGAPPMLSRLNATVTLSAKEDRLSEITLEGFSTRLFGGTVRASKSAIDPVSKTASTTLRLSAVPLFERLRLSAGFRNGLKGTISGTLPITWRNGAIAVRHARLSLGSGGTITQRVQPPKLPDASGILTPKVSEAVWTVTAPEALVNRSFDGRTNIDFSMGSLSRKAGGGELLLTNPKGSLELFTPGKKSSILSISDFSAGFFDGRVGVARADYDLAARATKTTVALEGIPLQKLLDLQGAKKIYATGLIRANIPVVITADRIEIPNGGMGSETDGQIIYATTPEERAAANPGLRLTYEALGNFLYSELVSSISMAPDGTSVITMQLKGHNPQFQEGRPVNLNITVEQNLLDLFRSLAISSSIEQAISEKALELQKKR